MILPRLRFVTFALIAAAGCSREPSATTRISDPVPRRVLGAVPTLVQCPAVATETATGLIGPLGGVLAAGNTQVLIPADAVLFPTSFTLTVPASPYAEIEVTPAGGTHFIFAIPVVVTIDYGRCGRPELDDRPLSVWNIDTESKALLEGMGGIQDKLTHTITFTTAHFSGYAVADYSEAPSGI
jgi:hypothetical protein